MVSTRETAGPSTSTQLTDARELRRSIVRSAEKPAVAKKVTPLRSRIKLRQFAPRRSTKSSSSEVLDASISPEALIRTTVEFSQSAESCSPARRVAVVRAGVVIVVICWSTPNVSAGQDIGWELNLG
jgi:hypothetical protein